ncbi:MAG: putative nucleotide-diphospho-sugar transferase, partial [Actinomycetota bacterium]|nr:putative nucleotide-diphospho-sugar transferase [Actinomycetota bacterium]
TSSCVHTALLAPAPYFAVWRPGPRALPWTDKDIMPHYASKEGSNVKDWVEHFHQPKQILMSTYCKSNQIEFVGVSLFSPAYEVKALRMLESCNKLGVCCKATEMPGDFLGASAPEGSDEFRYRTIALKPVFLLDQLEKTKEPVVFLDVDLEFHKFPDLFLPNSWPEGLRDVALFNFWANETNLTIRHTPNVGSAVAFFNQTYRSKKLLAAWAEAMQYGTNSKAPDDQVLDKLMKEGGWLKRVSVGWLPAAYLRLMPSFYRGVDPVIDHDRGTKPGVAGHSSVKPLLPPVMWTEKVDAAELKKDQEAAGRTFDTAAAVPAGSR